MTNPGTDPTQIGPYIVESELGRGGMGVVYLATDSRLDRKVAIKALPEHFAADPERLARFEREAKILASLTHSNIAGVYGLEEQDGARYLVMEYVEGETLQSIIARGPIAVDEALRIAVQVASGMEAAHDAGVIHRDLKPGNIVVTLQGAAKVLDFGLAKELPSRGSSLDLSRSPTATFGKAKSHHTAEGQIVGTAAYLSPEQARGKALDKRTDVWAFGCVLYEMLTGLSPYAGETATDSLGAILHKDPEWHRLPPDTPPTIQLLLRRCLAKDPNRRFRDIGDARVEIEEALRDPSGTSLNLATSVLKGPSRSRRSPVTGVGAALIGLVLGAVGVGAVLWKSPETVEPIRLKIDRGVDQPRSRWSSGPEFALSPDGKLVAFVAGGDPSTSLLYVRSLDQFDARPLSGTEGAEQPFFSPDGRWIGFFSQNRLRKVAVTGGSPLTLCETSGSERGGSWGDDGAIVIAPNTTVGLMVLSENGGQPAPLTTLNERDDERSHRWPFVLPGSRFVLFTSQRRGASFSDASIEILDRSTGQRNVLHHGGMFARYAASGHVVFAHDGTLYAAKLNPDTGALATSPAPVLEGVETTPVNGGADFAVSPTGSLLFGMGGEVALEFSLDWANLAGERTRVTDDTFRAENASLSPDGSKIALQIYSEGTEFDLWIYEVERAVASRLTFDNGDEMNPIWSPDGTQIVYTATSEPQRGLIVRNVDGSGEPRLLTPVPPSDADFPTSWSTDGSRIAFMRNGGGETRWDLWTIDVTDPDAEPDAFLATQFEERYPAFSPDGRWIAYASTESTNPQIYVRAADGGGGRWQISIEGGSWPIWSPDGSTLYYLWGGLLWSVAVTATEDSFRADRPAELFEFDSAHNWFYPLYGIAPEGDRFMLLSDVTAGALDQDESLYLILNWFTDLKALSSDAR